MSTTVGVVARNVSSAALSLAYILDDIDPAFAGEAREIAQLVASGEISPDVAMRLLTLLRMLASEIAPEHLTRSRKNGDWDSRWFDLWSILKRLAEQAAAQAWCVEYLAELFAGIAAAAAQAQAQREAAHGAWLAMRGELLPPTKYERFDFDHEPDASASEASDPSMEP